MSWRNRDFQISRFWRAHLYLSERQRVTVQARNVRYKGARNDGVSKGSVAERLQLQTVVKLSKRASDPLRNHLVGPLLMSLNKHFRRLATLQHSPGTLAVHCKHKTLQLIALHVSTRTQELSSVRRRTVEPNG